jgi:GntR family transcriptional regulator, transcriptional repressor for pyruvate dehydrogenase complex
MAFEPIAPRRTAVEACAEALERAILGGELAVGERLPPERRLAESFGVNRVTVRAALARLASSRLLAVRQGSGYVVRDFRHFGGPELLQGLAERCARPAERGRIVEDLLHVRRHLARAVLERLTERQGKLDVAPLRKVIARFEEAVAEGGEAVVAADLAIVAALLEATGSPVLQLCINPVEQAVRSMPWLCAVLYAAPEENLAGWRGLLAWLEAASSGHANLAAIDEILRERDRATLARLRRKAKGKTP